MAPSTSKPKNKLGEILLQEGLVTEEQMVKALEEQRKNHKRLGETLVALGFVKEHDVVKALAKQLGVQYASWESGVLKPAPGQELHKLVPEAFARQHMILPLSKHLNSLTVALADPLDLMAIDNVTRLTGCAINPVVAARGDLLKALDAFYGGNNLLREALALGELNQAGDVSQLSLDELKASAEQAPVVRLVDLIMRQAVKERATDIHVEPWQDKVTLRYRIDGVLYEVSPPPIHLYAAITSRLKILTNLDIAERRLPQDGSATITVDGRDIDLRISSVPSIYGEKIAIRLLDKSKNLLNVKELGLEPKALEDLEGMIHKPHGLILVTGPTGSGKSTTLYAVLNAIKSPRKHILTIEDPVEYRMEGINQIQVNANIGLTFAAGLRAFLRQDPDVIMVGEIRDQETAEICVRASLTGHLVLSTLHTNDAATAAVRLTDIGIQPFLISSTLSVVVAQRLLRRLCQHCKEPYEPPPALLQQLGLSQGEAPLLHRPKGCHQCGQSGYYGRMGIHEVLVVSQRIKDLILRGGSVQEIRQTSLDEGMLTLWASGLRKVVAGLTSVEEVSSVTLLEGAAEAVHV